MIIKYFAYIRDYTRTKEISLEVCSNVEEMLRNLCKLYGKKFENLIFKDGGLSSEIIILVNGRHITHYEGLDTKLKQDDVISIFPVVAGG